MIAGALAAIRDALNESIVSEIPDYAATPPAIVSDLVDRNGAFVLEGTARKNDDNILITLVNVQEDAAVRSRVPSGEVGDHSRDVSIPTLVLNLHVLFSAYSGKPDGERYGDSLDLVSWVVRYFKSKRVFTRADTPGLPAGVERISVTMANASIEDRKNIWDTLGVRYLPSVLCNVRLVVSDPEKGGKV